MRVLIAIADPAPGLHEGSAVDGELVVPVLLECDVPGCDCAASWVGLVSGGTTPLAEVADRPNLTRADLRRAIHGLLDRTGYVDLVVQAAEEGEWTVDGVAIGDPVVAVDDVVGEHLATIDEITRSFSDGAVVSRLGSLVALTTPPSRAA